MLVLPFEPEGTQGWKMKVKPKINLLVFGTVFIAMGALAYAMIRGSAQEAEYNSLLAHEVAQVESARQMQVTFKKHVQAWKDILIRGSDPASLENYSKEFFSLDENVDENASRLQSSVTNSDLRQVISQFVEAHKRLGENYRAGLEVFRASKGKDFAAVDAMVKGQDRAPTNLIDGLVLSLQKDMATHETRIELSAASNRRVMIAWSFAALLSSLLVAAYLSRWITSGIQVALERAEAIARGDLSGEEIEIVSHDELGDLSAAFNTMQSKLRNMLTSVADDARRVASASEEFSAVSRQITSNSEETTAQANAVSAATDLVNRNLQTVATGAEEMSVTIQDIARNSTESARVANEAVKTAETTNTTISKLDVCSAEIGLVIKVITSIAQQTNLLALNATIEAARAGEAGKGFAVVANEVKELAKQTAKATDDISRKIVVIQADTRKAVEAIGAIGGVIGHLNDFSAMVATAVEEQSATTNEMSRNVTEAAKSSTEISNTISGVAQSAQGTSSNAHDSMKAANALAQMSTRLRGQVEQFKLTNGAENHSAV